MPSLLFVLCGKHIVLRVEHHVHQLTRLDIVEMGEGERLIHPHWLTGRLCP